MVINKTIGLSGEYIALYAVEHASQRLRKTLIKKGQLRCSTGLVVSDADRFYSLAIR